MSATIWVDTDREQTIELGNTVGMYQAFSEMARVCTDIEPIVEYEKYPDLFCVPSQTEDTADADPEWLKRAQGQARAFLQEHRERLSAYTIWVLEQLTK